jgi:hypothetical protein
LSIYQAKPIFKLAFCILSSLSIVSSAVSAQETLRWKFNKGEQLKFNRKQERAMRGTVGDQPLSQTSERQTDVTLVVDAVEDDGSARITQTIDRVRFNQTTPSGTIQFDSASEQTGDGGQLVAALQPLVGLDFSYHMSPRGEVTKLQLSEASKKRLAENPAALPPGKEVELLRQLVPSMLLPKEESVSAGTTWQEEVELVELRVGRRMVTSTYEYTGSHESGGQWVADIQIRGSAELKPSPNAPVKVEILEESITGKVHFDPRGGFLVERSETDKTKTQISMEDQSFEQEAESIVTVTRVQDGATSGGKEATP